MDDRSGRHPKGRIKSSRNKLKPEPQLGGLLASLASIVFKGCLLSALSSINISIVASQSSSNNHNNNNNPQQSQQVIPNCSRDDLQACINMADPLLKDPQYIFPANMVDIDSVCRKWSQFVTCVRRYTATCLSPNKRQQFNNAVEEAVNSVHQLCTDTRYQQQYLQYAPCIKSISTDERKCVKPYRYLVDSVFAPTTSTKKICCSHHSFVNCILVGTQRTCDSGDGSATQFARKMLDKGLAFFKQQCQHYTPNRADCPGAEAGSQISTDLPPDSSGGNQFQSPFRPSSPRNGNNIPNPQGTGRTVGNSFPVKIAGQRFPTQGYPNPHGNNANSNAGSQQFTQTASNNPNANVATGDRYPHPNGGIFNTNEIGGRPNEPQPLQNSRPQLTSTQSWLATKEESSPYDEDDEDGLASSVKASVTLVLAMAVGLVIWTNRERTSF